MLNYKQLQNLRPESPCFGRGIRDSSASGSSVYSKQQRQTIRQRLNVSLDSGISPSSSLQLQHQQNNQKRQISFGEAMSRLFSNDANFVLKQKDFLRYSREITPPVNCKQQPKASRYVESSINNSNNNNNSSSLTITSTIGSPSAHINTNNLNDLSSLLPEIFLPSPPSGQMSRLQRMRIKNLSFASALLSGFPKKKKFKSTVEKTQQFADYLDAQIDDNHRQYSPEKETISTFDEETYNQNSLPQQKNLRFKKFTYHEADPNALIKDLLSKQRTSPMQGRHLQPVMVSPEKQLQQIQPESPQIPTLASPSIRSRYFRKLSPSGKLSPIFFQYNHLSDSKRVIATEPIEQLRNQSLGMTKVPDERRVKRLKLLKIESPTQASLKNDQSVRKSPAPYRFDLSSNKSTKLPILI